MLQVTVKMGPFPPNGPGNGDNSGTAVQHPDENLVREIRQNPEKNKKGSWRPQCLLETTPFESARSPGLHSSHVIQPTLAGCVLGEGRRIDFSLRSMSFSLLQSFASDDVDLGSDPPGCIPFVDLPKHLKKKRKRKT